MLFILPGDEMETFLTYAALLVSLLSQKQYEAFLSQLDQNRPSLSKLLLSLRFEQEFADLPDIDPPDASDRQDGSVLCYPLHDHSGYHIYYDLKTGGQYNGLTLHLTCYPKTQEQAAVPLQDGKIPYLCHLDRIYFPTPP